MLTADAVFSSKFEELTSENKINSLNLSKSLVKKNKAQTHYTESHTFMML